MIILFLIFSIYSSWKIIKDRLLDMIAQQMILAELGDWISYTIFATIIYFISKQLIQHCLNHLLIGTTTNHQSQFGSNNTNNNNNNISSPSLNSLSSSSFSSNNTKMATTAFLSNGTSGDDNLSTSKLSSPPLFNTICNNNLNNESIGIINNPLVLLNNVSFGGGVIIDQHFHIVFILEGTKDIFPEYQQLNQQHPSFLDLIEEDYKEPFVQFFEKCNKNQSKLSSFSTSLSSSNSSSSSSSKQQSNNQQQQSYEKISNLTNKIETHLNREPMVLHVHSKSNSNQYVTVEIKLTALYIEDSIYYFMALRDIGRHNKLDQVVSQLQSAVDDESKIDILSHISHELRTPISSIVASVQLFRATEVSSLQREYLSLIDSSTTSLLELISNVLDHDKMGSGKLSLNTVDFNLSTLIEDVCAMVSTQALRKGIEVASYIFTHCPLSIYGDPVRLRQILLNLLSNGIKFTEKGQVLVRVEPLEVNDSSLTLKFEVRDTGMGISEENIPKLFKKFSQFNSKTSSGHGLGLAISKDLVKLMGGSIWCNSKPGQGCSFYFTLKFDTPQKQLPCPVPNFNNLNALIVDSNESIRNVICDYLKEWNCKTIETSDVSKAIKEIKSRKDQQIELVIVDVDSTTLKSFLKLKRIMDIEYSGKIGLIMMSKDRSMVHGIGVGNTSKLTKPIRQSHLVACILASMPEYHLQSPELKSSIPPNSVAGFTSRMPSTQFLNRPDSTTPMANSTNSQQHFSPISNYSTSPNSQANYNSIYSKLAFSSHYQKDTTSKNLVATCIPPYSKISTPPSASSSSSSSNANSPFPNQPGMRRVTRRHSIDIVTFDHSHRNNDPNIQSIIESIHPSSPSEKDCFMSAASNPMLSPLIEKPVPILSPINSPEKPGYTLPSHSILPHSRHISAPIPCMPKSPSYTSIDPINIRSSSSDFNVGGNFGSDTINLNDQSTRHNNFENGSSSNLSTSPLADVDFSKPHDDNTNDCTITGKEKLTLSPFSSESLPPMIEPTVLVIDDSPIQLKLVKKVLEGIGLPVVCVESGEEGLDQFEKHQFAMILMDCEMPGIDGFHCTQSIRQRETERTVNSVRLGMVPHVPIIAMTAHSPNDIVRNKCLSVGMDDYISKPFKVEQLLILVRKWLEFYIERNSIINERIQRLNLIPLRNESDTESSSPSDDETTLEDDSTLPSSELSNDTTAYHRSIVSSTSPKPVKSPSLSCKNHPHINLSNHHHYHHRNKQKRSSDNQPQQQIHQRIKTNNNNTHVNDVVDDSNDGNEMSSSPLNI